MKKKLLFFLILAVLFSACKLKLSENMGTVVLDLRDDSRALDADGIPILNNTRMSLRIRSSKGLEEKHYEPTEEKSWQGVFLIGETINVRVEFRTEAAVWMRELDYTVTGEYNRLIIKLSKSVKIFNNFSFSTNKRFGEPSGSSYDITFNIGGKKIAEDNISGHSFCHDNRGRTYFAYKKGRWNIKRYTSEGDEEPQNFIPPIGSAKIILSSDYKTGKIYIFADISGDFKLFRLTKDGNMPLAGEFSDDMEKYAVYDNIAIFASEEGDVQMYRIGENALSSITLSDLPNLKRDTKIVLGASYVHGEIKDLYMTSDALYVLFSTFDNNVSGNGSYYSLGGIVKYSYTADDTTGAVNHPTRIGIKNEHSEQNGIFETGEDNFYGPIKVVGFDEKNIYIADDGVKFEYKNGKVRITENKNRIAKLSKASGSLEFEDSNAEWLAKETEWVQPAANPLVFFSLNKTNKDRLDNLILSNDVSGSEHINIASDIELDTDYSRNIFYTFDRDNNFYLGAKDKLKKFTKSDGSYNEDTSFVGSYTSGGPTETPYIKPTYDIVTETLYAVTNGGNYKLVKYTESGWSDTNIDNVYYEYAVYNNKVYLPADAGKMTVTPLEGSGDISVTLPHNTNYKYINDIFFADDYCYVLRKSNFDNLATLTYFDVNTLPSNTSVPHPIPEGQMKELSIEGLTKFENIKFTGYRDGKLYIAVDGIKRSAVEGAPKLENINKTVSFNTSAKTFDSPVNAPDGITWFREENEWHGTKTLVWTKNENDYGFDYYQLTSVGDSLPTETFKPGDGNVSGDNSLTDVFCYDEGGNLYIVKYRSGTYQVCLFELQDDGSYNTSPVIAGQGTSNIINFPGKPTAIAVDISGTVEHGGNPVNVLYYSYNSSGDGYVERLKWSTGFDETEGDVSFNFHPQVSKEITALAANKDGLFAALKESPGIGYTVTVQKYAHTGSAGGTAIQVLDEVINGGTWSRPGDVTALHIHEGFLYGLTAVQYCYAWSDSSGSDVYYKASISGKLLKIGNSTANFTGEANVLHTTELPKGEIHLDTNEVNAKRKEGGKFAPYRFIAVKPKKLVIASDGFWGYITDVADPTSDQTEQFNFIWDFSIKTDGSLEGMPASKPADSAIEFSKKLTRQSGSSFDWQ